MIRRALILVPVVVVLAAAIAGHASAATSPSVTALARQAGISWVRCVGPSTMARIVGHSQSGLYKTRGATESTTGHVYLAASVCSDLEKWSRASSHLYTGEVAAIATLYHEATHVRGTRNERTATCAGVRAATQITAARFPDLRREIADFLFDELDEDRPPAYKLHGTCSRA